MKTLILNLFILLFTFNTTSAQPFNQETNSNSKSAQLIGKVNKEALSSNHYGEWFSNNYENYKPNVDVLEQLRNELPSYTITAFMGTWCGDSKRQVPVFYKILEEIQFPLERLTLVAVSGDSKSYKQSKGGEEEGLNIHRVPTFIFYKDGKEVNRIVEKPIKTLEEDMLSIIHGQYTSAYYGVTLVHNLLSSGTPGEFKKKSNKILPDIKEHIKNYRDLNTYVYVLFAANKTEEAIAVAKLNIRLYPEESKVYQTLAKKLNQLERSSEALSYYEKALVLDPENSTLESTIASMKTKDE